MSIELRRNKQILIYKKCKLPLSSKIALSSFCKDLSVLFSLTKITKNEENATFIINIENFGKIEGYKINITNSKIFITGNDDLGLIFGLYTFLENYLNVPPFYKMEHIKLNKINSIKIPCGELLESPATRFRGWFINDEDLLSGFKVKGKRRIDYQFYNDVISPKMMKVICETALRHKMNLIIPSTFVDVMEEHEYNLVKICSDMGLYISQHHIEPLGVSKFGFANYIKDHELGSDEYSFISNKLNFSKVWEAYAKKWSDFPRVIWQLGLRSGLDRPVWDSDKNVGNSSDERGKLISDAIEEEYNIIKTHYKHEVLTSSTLWMEGAELLKNGNLNLPNDTIIVLSDVGISSLFGDDFFNIKRDSNKKYGFYYHAGFFHMGAHLADGVVPEKMKYCYELARESENDYYSILNVANIKDLLFSIFIHSKLAFSNSVNLDEIYAKYTGFFTKNNQESLINLIKNYYENLGDIGEQNYKKFCEKFNFSYHKYTDLKFPVVNFNDGIFRSLQISYNFEDREKLRTVQFRQMCENCYEKMNKIHEEFKLLIPHIDINFKECFCQHWVYQSDYLRLCYSALIHLDDGCNDIISEDYEKAFVDYDLAKRDIKNILLSRKKYFKGYFKDWFKNDRKISVANLINNLDKERDRAIILKKEGKI